MSPSPSGGEDRRGDIAGHLLALTILRWDIDVVSFFLAMACMNGWARWELYNVFLFVTVYRILMRAGKIYS